MFEGHDTTASGKEECKHCLLLKQDMRTTNFTLYVSLCSQIAYVTTRHNYTLVW